MWGSRVGSLLTVNLATAFRTDWMYVVDDPKSVAAARKDIAMGSACAVRFKARRRGLASSKRLMFSCLLPFDRILNFPRWAK